jgi:hypothetical protein
MTATTICWIVGIAIAVLVALIASGMVYFAVVVGSCSCDDDPNEED